MVLKVMKTWTKTNYVTFTSAYLKTMTKTCPECGLSLQGRDNESETCSDCLLGITDEQYKEKPNQPMKVKELIKLLEDCDRDLPVYIYTGTTVSYLILMWTTA